MTDKSTLVVGVTGHRFLAEVEKLEAGVRRALDQILTIYPGRQLTALSPLAEGADRLVARIALEREGAQLVVPLPLPVDDYMTDFASEQSRSEFSALLDRAAEVIDLPAVAQRKLAYKQVGCYVADNSDVLIALWDGQGSQGHGGTGEIVHRALDRGIPVFHVKAGNRKPGTSEPTSLGVEQGELVVYMNVP